MDKFFWEPDRADRIGIVGGIFEIDQVAKSDIEKLVDQFPNQSIDFFGALRSRLYDEQIRKLIDDVGLDRISQRVVNSTERPPEFHKPDFSLSHLLEVGTAIEQEQKRLQELRLVEEYNQTVRNRGLGEIKMTPQPVHNGATVQEPVRSQSAVQASNSYKGQPSSTRLTPEIVSEVNRILGQGQRLGIEVVDDRRFRMNSWNCYGMFEGDGAEAMSALETCLDENQRNYVRIVGIRDRQRVIETIVHRPNSSL
jgi:ribulose bisphosphate carboxylase small subunit